MKIKFTLNMLMFVFFVAIQSFAGQTSTESATANGSTEITTADDFTNSYYSRGENAIKLIYHLSSASDSRIRIYEITGKLVKDVKIPVQGSGTYNESIDREFLNDGIYIVELYISGKRFTRRLVIS